VNHSDPNVFPPFFFIPPYITTSVMSFSPLVLDRAVSVFEKNLALPEAFFCVPSVRVPSMREQPGAPPVLSLFSVAHRRKCGLPVLGFDPPLLHESTSRFFFFSVKVWAFCRLPPFPCSTAPVQFLGTILYLFFFLPFFSRFSC